MKKSPINSSYPLKVKKSRHRLKCSCMGWKIFVYFFYW